jgi:uroporphyrinogen decarboxylase
LTALRHEEPDRVPLDSGGCSATTISAVAYNRLRDHLGISGGPIAVYDVVQHLTMPEPWYLERFEIDVIDVTHAHCMDTTGWLDWALRDGSPAKIPPWIKLEKDNDTWVFRDEDGVALAVMPEDGDYFDQSLWPLYEADAEEYAHPERHLMKNMWSAMPRPLMNRALEPDFPELLRDAARALYEDTDYAIMLNAGVSLFETAQYLCRTDQLLLELLTERAKVETLLDRLLELSLAKLEVLLEAAGPYVHVIKINDDFGIQAGPMISPKLFREVFKPRHKEIYDFIKQKQPDMHILLHCDGSIYPLIPDLIEIGLDILNPVQTSTANMDPVQLKREFGQDLAFWGGGIDTQYILPWKTPQEVADDVRRNVEILAPRGGFIFSHIHNITPDVPPENIVAMFDAFGEVRDYT